MGNTEWQFPKGTLVLPMDILEHTDHSCLATFTKQSTWYPPPIFDKICPGFLSCIDDLIKDRNTQNPLRRTKLDEFVNKFTNEHPEYGIPQIWCSESNWNALIEKINKLVGINNYYYNYYYYYY